MYEKMSILWVLELGVSRQMEVYQFLGEPWSNKTSKCDGKPTQQMTWVSRFDSSKVAVTRWCDTSSSSDVMSHTANLNLPPASYRDHPRSIYNTKLNWIPFRGGFRINWYGPLEAIKAWWYHACQAMLVWPMPIVLATVISGDQTHATASNSKCLLWSSTTHPTPNIL